MFLEHFFPDEDAASTYEIRYDQLHQEGIRGLIFDIDNTLVRHGAAADEKSKALFKRLLEMGFAVMLLSNNKELRVKSFADAVGAGYIYKANKPSPVNYKKAAEQMGIDCAHTAFIGDQIFTDIWGAKKAGIRSVLVKPIHKKEEIQIVLKRLLEKPVLWAYEKKRGGKQ